MGPTYLVIDTETDGFNKKLPYRHDEQPRLLQVGALLVCDGDIKATLDFMVVTDRDVPEGAFKAHGISKKDTLLFGVAPTTAYHFIESMMSFSDFVVAYNAQFDREILRCLAARASSDVPGTWPLHLRPGNEASWFCAMEAARAICQISPTKKQKQWGFNGFKNPKLEEAHSIMLGKALTGAHRAIVDANATLDIFQHLLSSGHGPALEMMARCAPYPLPEDIPLEDEYESEEEQEQGRAWPVR